MLENSVNETNISQWRTPDEFINWFERQLDNIKNSIGDSERTILLHRGRAKVFYEELFPLYRLLQWKGKEWFNVKFRPVLGNQNFDIQIESEKSDVPGHIEITCMGMDYEEILRMEYYLDHRSVSSVGPVLREGTNRTRKKIFVEEELIEESILKSEAKKRIKETIGKKLKRVLRRDNTALLVYFDNYTVFSEEKDAVEIDKFLDSIDEPWDSQYVNLFVIGANGKNFWEKRKSEKR